MKAHLNIRRLALAGAFAAVTATAIAQDPVFQVEDSRIGAGPTTIEHRRSPVDSRVQAAVMETLRNMDHIEGIVGVETTDSVVTLTGKVTTSGQAFRAGRVARGLDGVRGVDNQIRSKVGGTF